MSTQSATTPKPLIELGMSSLVLGTIALLLAILPVLGIPISVFGLLFGIIAVVVIGLHGGGTLRWALAGLGVSALALGINIALAKAPSGYAWHDRDPPPPWQPPAGRPNVAPPEP